MKKKKLLTGRLILLALALSFSIVLIASAATLAAYTNSRHAQRTVATYETTGDRFSSNLLAKRDSKDNVKTLYVTDVLTRAGAIVTVCNYQQGKQTQPYERDISYSLTARLVKYDSSTTEKYVAVDEAYLTANSLTSYTVALTKGGTSVTLRSGHLSDSSFSGTLSGNETNSDTYALSFAPAFAENEPNLYVEMIATPTGNVLPTLRAVFKAELRAQGATNSWTGDFNDDTETAPSDYDGFNYVVSGMGSGTCTLRWDSSKVSLSYRSLSMLLAIDGATQDGSSVTFAVDSDNESRYDLQFYKENVTTETWTQMRNSVVTFTFR